MVEGDVQLKDALLDNLSKENHNHGPVKIFVSLKSPVSSINTKNFDFPSSSFILDTQLSKKTTTESKIYNMKAKQLANESAKLRSIPQINQISRKMVEAKAKAIIKTEQKLLIKQDTPQVKKDQTQPLLLESLRRHNSIIISSNGTEAVSKVDQSISSKLNHPQINSSSNIKRKVPISINTTENYESILSSPLSPILFKTFSTSNSQSTKDIKENGKKKSIVDRSKGWKESIQKKIEEKRQEKCSHELDGCTFQPQLCPKDDLISFSGALSKNSKRAFSKSSFASFSSLQTCKETHNQKIISEVNILPCTYAPLSPTAYSVKYDRGYNFKEFISKARPMANYDLQETEV